MSNNNQTITQKLLIGSSYSYLPLIIQKVIGIVTSVFLARILGPTNLGMISIVNYLLLLLLFFTSMGIPTALVKLIAEYQAKREGKLDEFILSSFFINFMIICLVTILYYLIASFISNQIYNEPKLVTLIRISALTLFFFSLNQFGYSVIQGFAEFKKLSIILIFNSLVVLLFLIPLTKLFGLKGAVLSQALGSISTFFFLLINIRFLRNKYSLDFALKNLRVQMNVQNIKKCFPNLSSLALPVFISGLVMNPVLPILTALLSRYRGFIEVGFFNVAYSLTQIILFIPTAVGTAFVPLASKLATEDTDYLKNFLLKTIYGVTIIVMLLGFIVSFFSREIIIIFYGSKYSEAQNILMLLSTTTFLICFGNIIGYYLLAIGKMWLATLLNFIWFILIVGPAFFLIRYLGLMGLGLTYLISYFILVGIFIFFLKKSLQVNINRLILYLGIGLLFLVAILLTKLLTIPYLYNISILILFFISFYLLFSKIVDKKLLKQLTSNWIHLANEKK